MGIEEGFRIDRIQGPATSEGPKAAPTDRTEFRRLLEKLEEFAKKSDQKSVEDIDQLEDAVRTADDSFKQVMDMRRMLEAAYRKALP